MKADEKAVLAKDGSGTLQTTMTIDTSKIKELMEMMKGMMPQPEAPTPKEGEPAMGEEEKKKDDGITGSYSKEEIEKQLKTQEGLELKEYAHETVDGKDVVKMSIAFKSFENLAKSGVLGNKAVTLVKNEDGSYTLTYDAKGGAGGEEAGGMEAMAPMLEPFIGGLEFKSELTVPGTIVETNGVKSEDGTKVNWTVGFKDMVGADKTKKDVTSMKVTFKGEGVELKPFSYKPDPAKAASKFGMGPK